MDEVYSLNIIRSGRDENTKDLDVDLKEVSENLLTTETTLVNHLAVKDLANCNYNWCERSTN